MAMNSQFGGHGSLARKRKWSDYDDDDDDDKLIDTSKWDQDEEEDEAPLSNTYNSHSTRVSFLEQKAFVRSMEMDITLEMKSIAFLWATYLNDSARHIIHVFKGPLPNQMRIEFTFDSKLTIAPPDFSAGQQITLTCASIDYGTKKPYEWTATISETHETTDGDLVAFVNIIPEKSMQQLHHGQKRAVTLKAVPNTVYSRRQIEAVSKFGGTDNQTVIKMTLNQAYDREHIAMRLVKNKVDLQKGLQMETEWVPVGKFASEPLDDIQKLSREAFKQTFQLNDKQEEFVHKGLTTESGYIALQGPPGTGKSFALMCFIFEIVLRKKLCFVSASTKAATHAIGLKMLNVWSFLPGTIKDIRRLVFLPQLSTLQKSWMRTDDDDADAYTCDLLGLLKNRLEPYQDPSQKEYHELGNHMLREHQDMMSSPNYQIKAQAEKWLNIYKKFIAGSRVHKNERTVFNTICGHLCERVFNRAIIIIGTISCFATPIFNTNLQYADAILHDEANSSSEADALILLNLQHGLFAEIGDYKQMEPTCMPAGSNKYSGVKQFSSFARRRITGWPIVQLDIQYRMHPHISNFPTKVFYERGIADAPKTKQINSITWFMQDFFAYNDYGKELMNALQTRADGKDKAREGRMMHRIGIDVPTAYAQGIKDQASIWSFPLINQAARTAHAMLTHVPSGDIPRLNPTDIVFLAPYNLEKRELRMVLARMDTPNIEDAKVVTIDEFLGGEGQVVFLLISACYINNPGTTGFLKDVKLLNASLTRAQTYLFILGNFSHWLHHINTVAETAPAFALLVEDLSMNRNIINSALVDTAYEDSKGLLPQRFSKQQVPYWLVQHNHQEPTHTEPNIESHGFILPHDESHDKHAKLQKELNN